MTRGVWLLVVAGAFVAGLVIGWCWGNPGPAAAAETKRAASPGSSTTVLHDDDTRDAFKLRQQLDILRRNQAGATLADHIAFFEKHKTPYGSALGLRSIDESLRVTDEMADFIQMTDSERKQVEMHLKQTADTIKELEKANLQIVKQDASGVTYQIAAFADGKQVKEDLQHTLRQDLGDQREDVLFTSGGYEWNTSYDNFGETPAQVQITHRDGATANEPPYDMLETYEHGSSRGGIYALPARYQGVLALPP